MAILLKQRFDILALRVAMDLSGNTPCVSLRLEGHEHGELSQLDEWTLSAVEFNLPEYLKRELTIGRGHNFTVPKWIIEAIRESIARVEREGETLWLHLAKPQGYLNLVPWESLLQSELGLPMLRLPDFVADPPRESTESLTVALCGSLPQAKSQFSVDDYLVKMARHLTETVPRHTTVHIFADAGWTSTIVRRLTHANLQNVHVHDPGNAVGFEPTEREYSVSNYSDRVRNPWLRWMRDALKGESVDMVQFVSHGYLSRDNGALALAESPVWNEDQRVARFVDAAELMRFLTQVGAWCAAFTSPEGNYSEMGLRLLADQVAQRRPGPILHHEIRLDREHAALADAYRFLFDRGRASPPLSPALFTYCNPSLVRTVEEDDIRENTTRGVKSDDESLLSSIYASETVPSWVGSSQRYIEQRTKDIRRTVRDPSEASAKQERTASVIEDTLREIESRVGKVLTQKGYGKNR